MQWITRYVVEILKNVVFLVKYIHLDFGNKITWICGDPVNKHNLPIKLISAKGF